MATNAEIIMELKEAVRRVNELVAQLSGEEEGHISYEEESLEVKVTKLIHEIGIPAHIKGYHYIRTAIVLSVRNPELLESVTKELYPAVAEKHNTTNSRVERAIRHGIESAWKDIDVNKLSTIFGRRIHFKNYKPTNSEFIAKIVDYILLSTM